MSNDLNDKEITRTFFEKELQKKKQNLFWIEKVLKKVIISLLNGRDMIVHVIV